MLFTLLLQSPYGIPKGLDAGTSKDDKEAPAATCNAFDLVNKAESGFCLSSSVPRLLAGYEDGSVCCYDIRTFRSSAVSTPML